MTAARPHLVSIEHVVAYQELQDGDLLLFRRSGLIAAVGRSIYSHAAMLGRWGGAWLVLEVREWHGGRIVTLESQVRRRPGRIDLYRADPEFECGHYNATGAVARMREFAGCPYGWASVLGAAMRHVPLVRCLLRPAIDDTAVSPLAPFCSQAVAMAYRAGGVDVVPGLSDHATEPADLARSAFFEYRCTLVP